jgi:ribose-phosphate pyrophosphokinase
MLNLPLVVMHKRREGPDSVRASHVVGDIEGKIPIVIDDVIAGGSVLDELDSLFKVGAREEAYLAITHGVLLESALRRLEDPRIKQLVISDTICQPAEIRNHPKIKVVSIAGLLADVIKRIHMGESISSLMDKAKV